MDFSIELGGAFARLNKMNSELICKETKLKPNEILLLFTVKKFLGLKEVTPKLIAEHMLITKSTASQLLSALETQKYVTREINEKDKRYFTIDLTKKGLDVCDHVSNEMKKYGDNLFKFLGEEDALKLIALLNKTIEYYKINKEISND